MVRQIINPRWANEEKTHIIAGLRYEDGKEVVASITNVDGAAPNPDWQEIMDNFGVEGVDKNSEEALASHMQRKQSAAERRAIEIERAQKEALFNAKAEAFDMDVVKNSTNRDLKNLIRRANTIMEVTVYTALLHLMENPIVNGGSSNTA